MSCPHCGMIARSGWGCCAHCGKVLNDGKVLDLKECEHEFEIVGPHCVLCGFKSGMKERGIGVALLMLCLPIIGICVFGMGMLGMASYGVNIGLMVLGGLLFFGGGYWAYREGVLGRRWFHH